MDNELTAYLLSGRAADRPSREYLTQLTQRYPWFGAPRRILAGRAAGGPATGPAAQADPQRDVIDAFLSSGEHRIVPDEHTPEYIAAAQAQEEAYDNGMATEELAEIYLAQGLRQQAADIYERLCLVYPEKSAYFVEIIEKIKK